MVYISKLTAAWSNQSTNILSDISCSIHAVCHAQCSIIAKTLHYVEQTITGSSGTCWSRKGINEVVYDQSNPLHIQSSLLQCLLKELPAVSGDVTVRGSVAYASQESWVYSASLRENILFGLPFIPDWYDNVIQLCALERVSTF